LSAPLKRKRLPLLCRRDRSGKLLLGKFVAFRRERGGTVNITAEARERSKTTRGRGQGYMIYAVRPLPLAEGEERFDRFPISTRKGEIQWISVIARSLLRGGEGERGAAELCNLPKKREKPWGKCRMGLHFYARSRREEGEARTVKKSSKRSLQKERRKKMELISPPRGGEHKRLICRCQISSTTPPISGEKGIF